MDPNQTLSDIEDTLLDHEMEMAKLHAKDLMEWLDGGGFQPDWNSHPMATLWFRAFHNLETLREVRSKLGLLEAVKEFRTELDEACRLLDGMIKELEHQPEVED